MSLGKPQQGGKEYVSYEIEDKTVYVFFTIKTKDGTLHIKHRSFLFFEWISVEGIVGCSFSLD